MTILSREVRMQYNIYKPFALTCLIIFLSGGTSGIGKVTSKKLFDLGYTVIITGRTQTSLDSAEKYIKDDNQATTGTLYKVLLDLSDFNSVQRAADTVSTLVPYLDVIVHNAAGKTPQFEQRCHNKVEGTVFNNAIAPLYLNRLLMPLLEKSPSHSKRIMFVTSALHDPEMTVSPNGKKAEAYVPTSVTVPDDFVGHRESWAPNIYYSLSKLGCVWNAFAIAERYPSISSITFCPGFVPTTNLNRTESEAFRQYLLNEASKYIEVTTQDQSSDAYLYYITDPEIDGLSGNYFRQTKLLSSSSDGRNREKRELYWDYANELIDNELNRIK
ncbi:NAD(P)-binding protein [Backusella circina FSU 941]|nr:NAD(P)-binding protein [Backusella circina FSU 941]